MKPIQYNLVAYLPINQVFIEKENFEDTIQDALDEALSEGFISFYDYSEISEDEDSMLYSVFERNGVMPFMKHIKYDINNVSAEATVDDKAIRYIIPITIDVEKILEENH